MDTRTWLFGEGRMDPNVVEINLRRGQLSKDREDEKFIAREGVRGAQNPQGEPHVIIRRQLLAIPHKISQDFKVSRHAQHSR
jgi:hypothetical protein